MPDTEHAGVVDRDALRSYADRIVSLRADRTAINADMGEVFKQAKDAGFVPEMIRGVVREMEMEEDARGTFYATQDAYRRALDLLKGTPLGDAAIEREEQRDRPPPRAGRRPRPFAQQPMAQNGAGDGKTPPGPKTPAEAAAEVFKPKGQQPNGSSLQIHD